MILFLNTQLKKHIVCISMGPDLEIGRLGDLIIQVVVFVFQIKQMCCTAFRDYIHYHNRGIRFYDPLEN